MTTEVNKRELNKKLAEWAGFIYDEGAGYIGGGGNNNILLSGLWYQPDNDKIGSPHPPDFTQSLDACFKWLVPKAIPVIARRYDLRGDRAYEALFRFWYEERRKIDEPDVDALALCLAIKKLVDEEKSGG